MATSPPSARVAETQLPNKITLSPFLKWPGGKRLLLKHIIPLFPTNFATYFEPFLGGGSVFFAVQPPIAFLSDKNAELINCYREVRSNPERLIYKLEKLENSEKDYYAIRSLAPTTKVDRAVRFLYLCSLSFNGIYRQNLRGEFNVPYGYRSHMNPCDPEKLRAVSKALSSTELSTADFSRNLARAKEGDLIYLDPPYTVTHNNNGFIKYNSDIFSVKDQVRLAIRAKELADRGCSVFVSNANHPFIQNLYKGFEVLEISRSSIISASSNHRRKISECVYFRS